MELHCSGYEFVGELLIVIYFFNGRLITAEKT